MDDGGIQFYQTVAMEEEMTSAFSKLASINVGEHIEKKGNFNYLSWPWAVKTLRETAPDATWEVIRFDGKPYCVTDFGVFVEVAVTVDGITLSQIHPVLDSRNKPIISPNAFDINTSIQRCLVKAIALHGLGLYIYAGEDLPSDEAEEKRLEEKRKLQEEAEAKRKASLITSEQASEIRKALHDANLNDDALPTQSGIDNIPAVAFMAALKKARGIAMLAMEKAA